jgi:MFS family permease
MRSIRYVEYRSSKIPQLHPPKYPDSEEKECILVNLSLSDAAHPHRFSLLRKWTITLLLCTATINMGYTSAVYSPAFSQITTALSTSRLVATLGLSLFIAGLGSGPMFFAPLSEFYGRRPIYLVSLLLFLVWLVPCARAESIEMLLVARFFNGVSGSAFVSVAGGTVGDMFEQKGLAGAMMFFTAAPL